MFGAAVAALVSLCGCSTDRSLNDVVSAQDVNVLVVDANLIVGQPLPSVHLRRTLPPTEPYDPPRAAVAGAEVFVTADSIPGDTQLTATLLPVSAGVYAANPAPVVRPNWNYHLRVVASDGRVVTADTHTPDRFHVNAWLKLDGNTLAVIDTLATFADVAVPDSLYRRNTIVYQDGLLEARFDRVHAAAYQVGLKSLDPDSPLVIDADFLSDEDIANLTRDPVSPPFDANNGNVRLPWFAIFFEGRYHIRILAVDQNWYDLIRSSPAFGGNTGGFGGNAGDQFERPIFHVRGGIGLFGSASLDEIGIYVAPKPEGQP